MTERGIQCHGLADRVMFGQRLDLMILEFFPNQNNSVIFHLIQFHKMASNRHLKTSVRTK